VLPGLEGIMLGLVGVPIHAASTVHARTKAAKTGGYWRSIRARHVGRYWGNRSTEFARGTANCGAQEASGANVGASLRIGCARPYVSVRHSHSAGPNRKLWSQIGLTINCTIQIATTINSCAA